MTDDERDKFADALHRMAEVADRLGNPDLCDALLAVEGSLVEGTTADLVKAIVPFVAERMAAMDPERN